MELKLLNPIKKDMKKVLKKKNKLKIKKLINQETVLSKMKYMMQVIMNLKSLTKKV